MTRSVSAPTLAAAGEGASQPTWLLRIDFPEFSTRLSSYGDLDWDGFTWPGGGFSIASFEPDGRPSQILIADDQDASWRTLVVGEGILDRVISLWKVYVGAQAAGDPVLVFRGYADGFGVDNGRVAFSLEWQTSVRQFAPRERIGPTSGVNFYAVPNTTVQWGTTVIKIEARRRS